MRWDRVSVKNQVCCVLAFVCSFRGLFTRVLSWVEILVLSCSCNISMMVSNYMYMYVNVEKAERARE